MNFNDIVIVLNSWDYSHSAILPLDRISGAENLYATKKKEKNNNNNMVLVLFFSLILLISFW